MTHDTFNTVFDTQKRISIKDSQDDFLIRIFRTIKATVLHQKKSNVEVYKTKTNVESPDSLPR